MPMFRHPKARRAPAPREKRKSSKPKLNPFKYKNLQQVEATALDVEKRLKGIAKTVSSSVSQLTEVLRGASLRAYADAGGKPNLDVIMKSVDQMLSSDKGKALIDKHLDTVNLKLASHGRREIKMQELFEFVCFNALGLCKKEGK